MFLGKSFIKRLNKMKLKEHVDMYGHVHLEQIYNGKKGTPTMGGIIIIFSILISSLLWARLDNMMIWFSVFSIIWFGAFGFLDDYTKMKTKKGLSRTHKLIIQILFGLGFGFLAVSHGLVSTDINLPFLKNFVINLGWLYIFWACLVLVSTTNAVNFTDGLDGLAIGSVVMVASVLAIASYIVGHVNFSKYLFIPYVSGAGELTVICCSIIGAGLGFLWFNSQPAEVFMGDVGSSSLGGVLGVIALLMKEEYLIVIAGGLFVLEAFSVVAQIFSVRFLKKRIFKAAPFHHHLQLLGWTESKITIRLWIISFILAILSLITLKLR